MTESQWLAFIRSTLRSKWLRWPVRAEALKIAKRPKLREGKHKFEYQCAICEEQFTLKEVEVDHFPVSAGSIISVDDIGKFCNNLFCEIDNLRVVCKTCHGSHTYSEKMGITFEEALIEKKVIEFGKLSTIKQKEILTDMYGSGRITFLDSLTNAKKRKDAYRELLTKGGSK